MKEYLIFYEFSYGDNIRAHTVFATKAVDVEEAIEKFSIKRAETSRLNWYLITDIKTI